MPLAAVFVLILVVILVVVLIAVLVVILLLVLVIHNAYLQIILGCPNRSVSRYSGFILRFKQETHYEAKHDCGCDSACGGLQTTGKNTD